MLPAPWGGLKLTAGWSRLRSHSPWIPQAGHVTDSGRRDRALRHFMVRTVSEGGDPLTDQGCA
jgi:hypothetical protein